MEIQAIKKYMKDNHITYEMLAQRSKLSISTIKKIFSGISQYPRIDTMQAIERALGLDRSELRFTAEDKEAGIEPTPTAILTADELELLESYRAIKDEQGEKTAHAIRTLVQNLADGK